MNFFKKPMTVIGVVHCPAFPGTPRHKGDPIQAIYDAALADAHAYASGGVDALIVENHGDIPFLRPQDIGPETAAFMTSVTTRVINETGLPTGINVLANAPIHAIAIAAASGAQFVRVNQWANAYVANEGILDGDAARALRYRHMLGADHIAIFADSHVKHGAHAITSDRSVEELTRDLEFFDADVVIATGNRTGDAVKQEELSVIDDATSLPVVVGSGVTIDSLKGLHPRASGVIIGSSLKEGGRWENPVDIERVETFMSAVREIRGEA